MSTEASKLISGGKIEWMLENLYTIECECIKPIPYTLQYINNKYVAIQETLNIGEEATSWQEVERLLASSIIKLYKKLTTYVPNKLGPYPKKLLSFLEKYIT